MIARPRKHTTYWELTSAWCQGRTQLNHRCGITRVSLSSAPPAREWQRRKGGGGRGGVSGIIGGSCMLSRARYSRKRGCAWVREQIPRDPKVLRSQGPTHTEGPYLCTPSGSPPCSIPSDTTTSFLTVLYSVSANVLRTLRHRAPIREAMQLTNEGIGDALDRIDAEADTAEIAFWPRALAGILLVFLWHTADSSHTLSGVRDRRHLHDGHTISSPFVHVGDIEGRSNATSLLILIYRQIVSIG